MKNTLLIVLSILMFSMNIQVSHAGEQEDSLNAALTDYNTAVKANDISTVLDHTYPSVFLLASKEEMLASLEQVTKSGAAPEITFLETKADFPIKNFSEGSYTTIDAETRMTMNSPSPEDAQINEVILSTLRAQMGEQSEVSYDAENGVYTINKIGQIVAINEGDSGWKFLDLEHAKTTLAQGGPQLMPEDIAAALLQ